MSVLYIALPAALVISTAFVWAFVWATCDGQMDDLETPAMRMLADDASSGIGARPSQKNALPDVPQSAEA